VGSCGSGLPSGSLGDTVIGAHVLDNEGMAYLSSDVRLISRFSRVLSVLVIAVCVLGEAGLVFYGHPLTIVHGVAPIALIGYGAWVLFWVPLLVVGPAQVVIVNPARTWEISWPAILDIQTKWGLTLVTPRGRVNAWASPAQNRYSSLSRFNRDALGRPGMDRERIMDTERAQRAADRPPSSIAGLAPLMITKQWEEYRDRGLLGTVEGEGMTVRWHRATLIVLAALVVLTVVGFVIN
jgi:hypothetical protein